ncbi:MULTISPECIES: thiamine biosynthesis protein ThiF [Bacillus]|uniref:thiamine biosynthesis protein ThiF n=1 Tax=Bacillus TaxID=1386 RepID=UPI00273D222D|nr:thiamine biosynthesis protein ThiF [Bacillus sp. MMSF_3328]
MSKTVNVLSAAQQNWYQYKEIYPLICQLGTGGTGGYLVQHIAQLLSTSKIRAAYVIADPDVIEEKNLGNQLFLPNEVGLKKADVLARRYSAAYDLDIGSYSEKYIETTQDLRNLFSVEYLETGDRSYNTLYLPIIIGTVDNNFTRKVMHDLFKQLNTCIYIDAGNENATVPKDWQQRPKEQWNEEELAAFQNSGWSGQVVTGVNLNFFKQAPVAEVFPDILNDQDEIRPSELSCTELTASEPQRLIVNKFAALAVLNVLTQLIEDKIISSHITFFHAKRGYMRSTDTQSH